MGYLYITEHGAIVGIEDNRIIVRKNNITLREIPIETLESISIFGKSQLTTQCIEELLLRGIPVSYYSEAGKYFGKLCSTGSVQVERQRRQAAFSESDGALELSKKIISAKTHNQLVILQRYSKSNRSSVENILKKIKQGIYIIPKAKNIAELMGYEGIIARNYFEGLKHCVDEEFDFKGRNRKPPRDPVNSLLSLGYSILMNEIYGKAEARGLHPYFGFMHSDKEKHPTFCSDMMEEWRAVIVDSTVLSIINGHEIELGDFTKNKETGAVYLTKEGMNKFIAKLERKMNTESKYLDYINYSVPFRRAIELQLYQFVKVLEMDDAGEYHPVMIR